MHDKTVFDRAIGCNNGCLGPDGIPLSCFNSHLIAIFNFDHTRFGENATATIGRGSRQTIQILEGMKLGLSRKSKDSISSKFSDWNVVNALDLTQTGPVRGVELVFQICDRTTWMQKEVASDPEKVAIE